MGAQHLLERLLKHFDALLDRGLPNHQRRCNLDRCTFVADRPKQHHTLLHRPADHPPRQMRIRIGRTRLDTVKRSDQPLAVVRQDHVTEPFTNSLGSGLHDQPDGRRMLRQVFLENNF